MGLNLLDLIGDIAGAGVNPQLNTSATQNAQGQLVNPQGQVVGPFQRPGWWARAFSPMGQAINQANMSYMENPLQYSQLTKELLGRSQDVQNNASNLLPGMSATGLANPDAYRTALMTQAEQNTKDNSGNNVFGENALSELAHTKSGIATLPSEERADILKNSVLGLESGGPFTLQWNPAAGRFERGSNPLSILGGGSGGTGSSSLGNVQRPWSFDPYAPAISNGDSSVVTPAIPTSVGTVAKPNVTPEQTRSLLGVIGHSVASPFVAGHNYLSNNPVFQREKITPQIMTALTGSPAATAPTEQDVDAARNELLSNGKRVAIYGGYEMDKDGNIYHNGKFVPETQLEGTPMASIRQKLLGIHKDLKAHIAQTNLPHNQ